MFSNENNINYDDFKNICRMCMFNCDIKVHMDCVISSVFHKLTDLRFETNDDLPQQICRNCFEKINEIHDFIFQCKRTHFTLTKCLNNYKMLQLNNEQNVTENIDIKIECEPVIHLEVEEDPTNIYEEMNENIEVEEQSEINNEQNIIEPDLFASNAVNIKSESDYFNTNSGDSVSSNVNLDVLNENLSFPYIIKSKNKNEKFKRNTRRRNICSKKRKLLISTHSGERPYICSECPKSYVHSSHLTAHMRTHSDKRPYICELCSKSFKRPGHLKEHIRTHTGERPYQCDQCSKKYTQWNNLHKHMRTH